MLRHDGCTSLSLSLALSPPPRELRAPADQRVHHAVVPHHVRHLPAPPDGAEDLGLGVLRGLRGSAPCGLGHLGEAGRVSRLDLHLGHLADSFIQSKISTFIRSVTIFPYRYSEDVHRTKCKY